MLLDLIFAFKYYKHANKDKLKGLSNRITREAYSNAYELSERKRDYIISRSYHKEYSIPKEKIPYDVHNYLAEICKIFRNTISQITSINKEHMSVTIIYHYVYDGADKEDEKWRWVVGKESTTQISLDKFINEKTHYILIC